MTDEITVRVDVAALSPILDAYMFAGHMYGRLIRDHAKLDEHDADGSIVEIIFPADCCITAPFFMGLFWDSMQLGIDEFLHRYRFTGYAAGERDMCVQLFRERQQQLTEKKDP